MCNAVDTARVLALVGALAACSTNDAEPASRAGDVPSDIGAVSDTSEAGIEEVTGEQDDVSAAGDDSVMEEDTAPDAPLPARAPLAWLTDPPREQAEPRLLFIGLDGVRPDAMEQADTPAFDLLRDNGSWTLTGTTQLTTATDSSAGWTAVVTGVDSTFSGVTDNASLGSRDWAYASFGKLLVDLAGAEIVLTAHWFPFAYTIFEPEFGEVSTVGEDDVVTDRLAASIASGQGHVFILHLDDVDAAGHSTGFNADNPDYIAAIEAQDARTQRLIDAINVRPGVDNEDWLVMVVTDHGGDAEGHGNMNADCQTIPFIFAGGGRERQEWTETVSHLDVAPTIFEHFSVLADGPDYLQGVPR